MRRPVRTALSMSPHRSGVVAGITRRAERGVGIASTVLNAVAAACMVGLLAASTADALGRHLRGSGFPGVVEYGELLLVGVALLSLASAYRHGAHVAVEFVTSRLPPRAAAITQIAGLLIAVVVLGWLIWASAEVAWNSWLIGEVRTGLVQAPLWPARFAVVLGFAALLFEIVSAVLRTTPQAIRRTAQPASGRATGHTELI